MQIKVKTSIGKTEYEFNIEEKNDMESLHVAAILGNPPRKCTVCEQYEWFKLDSNKDKEGNIYVNVVCKCGAKSKLGQYKAGGYFWHKFEKYEGKQGNTYTKPDIPEPNEADYKKAASTVDKVFGSEPTSEQIPF